ncbi:MAG: bifunctional phosphopantothenoylcysteine decarboxylase/phosphopantothenate--cysteine ligase CoaBC [Alphaproteobacteria bacterium]|nr:bifunctional phosphopantothenoylcysteine decarboxylase/phosphopantothenate--cysteine ligase CoaBC [Alphaproteobacteria bacterium]
MSHTLTNRSVLLIISGGIAAYKSLNLIRRLREQGAKVRGILTKGGAEFITPLSVTALSGEPVFTDLFSLTDENKIGHINLSREADLIVVAPATANLMARMAHGLADDLASTVLLAADKPVMIAPAMNVRMWRHAATQANAATLRARGIAFIGPAKGMMACSEEGEGRMAEAADILAAIEAHFAKPGPLTGKRVLVTSGPTYEPIDPVRFIGNRSSGKQGLALAIELARQGAETVLVTGPTVLPDPAGVKTVHINTAREMLAACEAEGPFDIAVCAAAVADWRPVEEAQEKLKKGAAKPIVHLAENPDILAALAHAGKSRPQLVIGFAAETGDAVMHAKAKFERKGCDWIVANEVGSGKAFGKDDNEVTLLRRIASGGAKADHWPSQSKENIARQLVGEIAGFLKTAQEGE